MSRADVLSALLALTGNLVALVDASGRIATANDALTRACGGGLAGRTLDALLAAEADATHRAAVASFRSAGAADLEIPFAALGRTLWGRLRSRAVGEQHLVVIEDVTELRQQRLRAEDRAELLDLVLEFGELGVWERDVASGEGHWDRHMHRMFQVDPHAGTPHIDSFLDSLMPGDRVHEVYRQSLLRPGRYRWRYRQQRADGTVRHFTSSWEVKADAEGRARQVVGVVRDDTEAHELAQSFDTTVAGLRLAVDLGNIAFWRQDLADNRIHLDERGYALLQLHPDPQGIALDRFLGLVHPDDLAPALEAARRALDSREAVDLQLRVRRADGRWRHLATRRILRVDESGAPQAFHGVLVDLSDPFEATHRALELARRLDVTVRSLGVGLWSQEAGGRWTWNEQMFRLHRLEPAPAPPSPRMWLRHCVAAEDRARLHREARRWLRGDTPKLEIEYRVAGSPMRWVRLAAQRQPAQDVVGIAMDNTEQRRTAEALRAASDRVALAARAAGIGSWELDVASREAEWDEQMFRLRGREGGPGRVTQATAMAWVHPDDRERMLRERHGAIIEQRLSQFEFRIVRPDGEVRWIATQSMVECDEHGTPVRQIGINWDVTEARRVREALQDKAVAERESQAKSALLARFSHDLRTPLNAVLGFTQLLRERWGGQVDAETRNQLDEVHRAGMHLLGLVDDVLELAQLERTARPAVPTARLEISGRLLYIEDNPVNMMVVEELVRQRTRLELHGCATGREGVQHAREWQPQLILVDMQLPDIDGYAVLDALRAHDQTRHIRCIALSANAMPADIRSALDAGFIDYWTKPIDVDRFVAGLGALL